MRQTRILVLEDDPIRQLKFKERFSEKGNISYTMVETAEDCKSMLKKFEYEAIFLDHDLGGEVYVDSESQNTGGEVARWIESNRSEISGNPLFVIHSLNTVGSEYMSNLISKSFDEVYRIPFVWEKREFNKMVS